MATCLSSADKPVGKYEKHNGSLLIVKNEFFCSITGNNRNTSVTSNSNMSFDLYFYKRKDSQQTEEQLAEYLTNNLSHNISDHPRQWNYENPTTSVYFLIDWNEPEDEPERIEIFDNFQDFKYLNFSFSINFFSPRFFGLEIFPIIEKLIRDLDLYVLDSQDETDPDNPRKFPVGYFQEQ